MVHLCIVVYNRIGNLKHWLECWDKCEKGDTQLVVIHNYDEDRPEYKELCDKHNVLYIPRRNRGFDIGAFQDVCYGRLKGFPRSWERILWVTDDTWPMARDFVKQYEHSMPPEVGVACMDVNPYVRQHIRTTGFMIDRTVASRLTFPADPVLTKEDCYQFEHRSPNNTFLAQIQRMGYKVRQVQPLATAPLWDTNYQRKIDRMAEHNEVFGFSKPREVTFICPIYHSDPGVLISCLFAQTNPNWKLWLIHDGPAPSIPVPGDERIQFMETPERKGLWGHPIRKDFLQKVDSEFVVITNPDNYHAPVYIEHLMRSFDPDTVGAYSGQMVHSYKNWEVIDCSLNRGYIDCASMMLRTKKAQTVGWNHVKEDYSDWLFYRDLLGKYGPQRFKKINECLLVHN